MIRRDLTGKRFGRWEVLEPCVRDTKDERWLCACECGTKKPVNKEITSSAGRCPP